MSDLTEAQQAALDHLRQITNGEDPERELAVLESVGWNVEKAAQAFFDDDLPQAGPSMSPVQPVSIDDSAQSIPYSNSAPARNTRPVYPRTHQTGLNLANVVAFPFTLITNILQFIFRIIRFPLVGIFPYLFRPNGPALRGSRGPRGGRGMLAENPAAAADRFVRELEDETGAMTISHANAAEAGAAENVAGSSTLAGKAAAAGRLLPDFFIGSYEEALRTAERELRVLCAIILSSEHDDIPEFRRMVLTDADFIKTLADNNFVVWGGDIRDRDAYQASIKLGATTYPFVGFVSLHPTPAHVGGSTPSGSGPRLTVLSRHEGPPSTTTSAQTLQAHITTALLPRVTPLLSRLRTERWNREQERKLREEQDRAFAESAARDRERVKQKREAERKAAEEKQARLEAEKEKASNEEKLLLWRRYARKHLIPPEPPSGGIRIGVRLPDGRRGVRMFSPTDDVTAVYTFAESLLVPASEPRDSDPDQPPTGYTHDWKLKLVTSFPRKEIPQREKVLGSIDDLKEGANLVVEVIRTYGGIGTDDHDEDEE
ncbi:uncharacterized protein EI90DRAFT_3127625 [Cantharellus anzutake]|uniref:uncharacterized protein n=1 Tax=Cantharellus anzutake TaxID=1750568 RepID=UPI001908A324|nr:uncharacterized protein EI90DRAFT_2937890 [Cantharellus anzutake]XP_038913145.1 uncharacterized protein EI90DRAFT_3127625 [Cantharellus anzutake]KAF8321944.1 hypothetical protein EI90DRAFT_2937890 [Cantharellus anzutake]KAF8326815.1 hypothetical protein EI90DRAFT_3127625 [Cantharellus anzutake]